MKSSIKTFLAGKNPYNQESAKLDGSVELNEVCMSQGCWVDDGDDGYSTWNIDVLDDGTCITYCAN
jgi:hypothetical protein